LELEATLQSTVAEAVPATASIAAATRARAIESTILKLLIFSPFSSGHSLIAEEI
jgi:hypothetical protein